MKNLRGIMPPIATPFFEGELALDKLEFNIHLLNSSPISGFVVMGSNGESVFLTRDEKLKLIETTKKHAAKDKLIIAGTGSDSIKETISLSNAAADLGADFVLVLTPSFYKSEMKPDAFIKYFESVANKINIPLIIYNVPKFTGVDIDTQTVVKLSYHPNIAGIKNSSENIRQTTEIISLADKNFKVIIGTASVLFAGISAGAHGGILALANIAPNECVDIQNLTEQKKFDEALEIQKKLIPVNNAVTNGYGVAGLKAAMDMIGFYGGVPREPLLPLNEENKKNLMAVLFSAGLIKK